MKSLDKKALDEKAKEIMKTAEEKGVQSNFFFITTFQRYLIQIDVLSKLEEMIKNNMTAGSINYFDFLKLNARIVINCAGIPIR